MKNALLFAASAAVAAAQHGYHGSSPRRGPPSYRKPLVDSTSLQKEINIEDLMKGSQKLQDIADANDGTRVFGSSGSNATIDWLFEELTSLGTYDVYKHYFIELFSDSSATLAVEGSETDFVPLPMSYTTPTDGVVVADFIQIAELGCETSDFPAGTEGSIALISRGTCTFATKAENAYLAGAVGAVIYNNLEGSLSGTLGGVGEYAPVVGVTQEEGQAIAAMLENGPVSGELEVQSLIENRTTANIIAQTKGGDQDNVLVLGGHTDSVAAGPGINDDGSGIVGCLEVARGLSKFEVTNAVRFAFWSAEEFGLLGSYAYLKSINSTEGEVDKILGYLNFDMIASPNYVLGVYDGDGSAFNLTGPDGSAEIEQEFQDFFTRNGEGFTETEFSGRSDYAAFLENGVPSGGLFTGAEQLKTEEEALMFGGEAGVAYDINYHQVGDTIDNINQDAYLINTKAIANSVARYARGSDSLPRQSAGQRMRSAARERAYNRAGKQRSHNHGHKTLHAPCGHTSDST